MRGWLWAGWFAASAFCTITAALIARMSVYLAWSVTNALWADQWYMLEELAKFRAGQEGWSYLWVPYWGHRAVIPRLLFLLDERLFHFSNVPLVILNMAAQSGIAAMLMTVEWRLLRERSKLLALFAMAATAQMTLSSMQLENFVYGMAVQYTLGLVSAVAAITLWGHRSRGVAIANAFISTLTIAAGLLVWIVLVLIAIRSRAKKQVLWTIAAIGAVATAIYLVGYAPHSIGMGWRGMLERPWQAFLMASMFLGGPISLFSVTAGECAGAFGIGLTVWLCMKRTEERNAMILTGLCVFFVLLAVTIVSGRLTPELVIANHGEAPLPSRYMTVPLLFWSCLLPAAISAARQRRELWAIGPPLGIVILTLTLGTAHKQKVYSEEWMRFCQGVDLASAGFLVGAVDQERMNRMSPEQARLDLYVPYLREHRLAIFGERRAEWIGRHVDGSSHSCSGYMNELKLTERSTVRLTGRVEGATDVLFTENGVVVGVARSFEHPHDFFFGYAKTAAPQALAHYAILSDGEFCAF